ASDIVEVHPLGGSIFPKSRKVLQPPHGIGALKRELLDQARLLLQTIERDTDLVQIALNELAVDQDSVEEVVEIMGHSRGHLADGFEASGRDELVLGAPQIVVRAPQVIRIASALDGHG